MSETEQSASRVSVPRAVIPPFERPPLQTKRDVLADVTLVTPRERRSNLRRARLRKKEEEPYFSPERQADLISERPALARQKRNKKPGDPSRSVPLAFDELGNFVKPLAGRIPARQATQAHLLLELGLSGKARRQAWCSLVARRRDCFSGNPEHQFYSLCRCGNRYCPTCGPKCSVICSLVIPGYALWWTISSNIERRITDRAFWQNLILRREIRAICQPQTAFVLQ